MGVPLSLAFLMLAPGFLQVMVGVNNNNLLFVFSALATWMLMRLLRVGLRWNTTIWLGIALGLGMLTKLYMTPLIVATTLVYWHVARPDWRTTLKHLMLVGGLVMLIAGWWYIHNLIQYGDPTAASETEKLLQTARPDQIDAAELWGLVTLWGGKMWLEAATVYMTLSWLEVVSWILLVIFFGGVLALIRGRLQADVGVLVMGAFVPALLMAIYGAQRNLHGDQSPPIMRSSLPLLCLFFAAALLVWIPARWRDWVAIAGIVLLAGFVIFWQITYFLPQYPPFQRTNALTHQMQIDFENGARLIDYQIDEVNLHQGDTATVTLCWQATETIDNTINAAFTVQLVHPDAPTAAATDGFPMSGRRPTSVWRPGEAFCEDVPLRVHEDAVTPRAYDVRVGLYIPGGDDLSYTRADGSQSTFLILDQVGVIDIYKRPTGEIVAWVDDWGTLENYDLTIDDGSLELALSWVGRRPAPADYNMFLHVLNDSGEIVAQVDRPPIFPTRFWGDTVEFSDMLSLDIPDEAAAFHFGLYDPVTGTRAMWQFPNPPDADHIILDANR
jgi:hypothetical protein